MDYINLAQKNIKAQSKSLSILAQNIPKDFAALIEYILEFKGRVILMGMGKSGYIAKKISASLASTGTPAFYIHPGEASHGDLGMITESDMLIMLSTSGETKELFDTINYCKRFNIKIAAMTMNKNSTLAMSSDFLLNLPEQNEISSISAPTTSSLMKLSLGDALVTVLHQARGFTKDDYKIYHPGGKLGARLLKVADIMHKEDDLPLVFSDTKFTQVIIMMNQKRLGCAVVVNKEREAVGIITNGDLIRHINEDLSDKIASEVMTNNPIGINANAFASEALFIMNQKSITAILVTDEKKLIGIIHIHDLLKHGVV